MSNNPMEPVSVLRDRIAEKVREMGVELVQFTLPNVPAPGEETVFYGVFVIADEEKYQGDVDEQIDQHNFDEAFASLVQDFEVQDVEDKTNDVKERMAQRLRDMQKRQDNPDE